MIKEYFVHAVLTKKATDKPYRAMHIIVVEMKEIIHRRKIKTVNTTIHTHTHRLRHTQNINQNGPT